jgi:hypothetical protein
MMMSGFLFFASIVAMLHVAALSFAFGPWHWKYVIVTAISGAMLWGVFPVLLPLRRWSGLALGMVGALMVQQAAFWFWRAKLGGIEWPLAQFASIHFLMGLSFDRVRRRRQATFVWRGTMINQRR